MSKLTLVIVIYVLIGVFTVGHVVNNPTLKRKGSARGDAAAAAMIFWPIYWSIEFQRTKQEK